MRGIKKPQIFFQSMDSSDFLPALILSISSNEKHYVT